MEERNSLPFVAQMHGEIASFSTQPKQECKVKVHLFQQEKKKNADSVNTTGMD
jgi:hypothetical protein